MNRFREDRFGYPMNLRAYATRGIIWGQRFVFSRLLNGINDHRPIPPDYVGEAANDAVRKVLEGSGPCLVARFGFDVALLGCGAYGMSLGAFIKRDLGLKAVHLGGVTQVLFGIKGGRYDSNPYYNRLYNDFWVRPNESERPSNFLQHEGGAYW